MKIIVIGGTGHVGSFLAPKLNASMLRTCLEVLKANDVDVNALEEKNHQPGNSLAGIKLPFDAEGNRVN